MAIQFEVETGTASATATSYVTVAQYKQYWENRGTTISDTDDQIKTYLNLSTEFLDNHYNFIGEVYSQAQALQWPRTGCYDKYGMLIASDTIPNEILNAVSYMGPQAKAGKLNIIDQGIKSESYGPVSKTYLNSSSYKSYPYIDNMLKIFIFSGKRLVRVN